MDSTPKKRIDALMREKIAVVPYDERWPHLYAELELRLKRMIPRRRCSGSRTSAARLFRFEFEADHRRAGGGERYGGGDA